MSTDDDTAKALARWLETPGAPPPSDLDRSVIEAIYALRPDLAPAPRLTADDILATVTRGPLVDPSAGRAARLAAGGLAPAGASTPRGGEVVAFPGDMGSVDGTVDTEPDRATRRTRWWWWAGGTGGVGLAIAAAATLTLIALPEMPTTSQPAGEVLLGREQAAAPASSMYREEDLSLADEKKRKDDAPPPQAPRAAPLPLEERQVQQQPAVDMVGGAGDGAGMRDEVIPEVASTRSAAKEEAAELDAPAEPPPPPPAATSDDLGALAKENEVSQSAAAPAAAGAVANKASVAAQDTEEAWRQDVDDRTLDRIDDALRRAERVRAKNPAEAASILAEVVGPPAAAGQHVAALAAADYLTAGNPDAAEAVASQGLALSEEPSTERARLQVLEQEAAQQSP